MVFYFVGATLADSEADSLRYNSSYLFDVR